MILNVTPGLLSFQIRCEASMVEKSQENKNERLFSLLSTLFIIDHEPTVITKI